MKAKLIKDHADYHLVDDKRFIIGTTDKVILSCTDKQKLSLSNCQAIERGYDLDELVETEYPLVYESYKDGFKSGFQKALELMGDKKFSEEDMKRAWLTGTNVGAEFESMRDYDSEDDNEPWEFAEESEKEFIQSLQQTEWDVEVEMWFHGTRHKKGEWIPKLDADGCLILKLKSE